MKFLADMGVSVSTIASLREAGHDSVHLRDEGLIRMEDADILHKARSEGRVVLTFDLDFGDLVAQRSRGEYPCRSIPKLPARPASNDGYGRTRAD